MLDKRGGVARTARLVLARRRAGETAILVGLALRQVEIACGAGLVRALLDAFLGPADAVRELTAIGNAERTRRTGQHIVLVQRFDPEIDRAGQAVQLVGLDHGSPVELEMFWHPRLARPTDQSGDRDIGHTEEQDR